MRSFDSATLTRLTAGEVDFIDAVTLVFDSGTVSFFFGGVGQFEWTDSAIGTQTFYGLGALAAIELPASATGGPADAIRLRLFETYFEAGADTPTNVFDDGLRASIDEEDWEGRTAILSRFWRTGDGAIIEREQVAVRVIDAMPIETDEAGNPVRVLVLEEPDIIQRDIEGKTANVALQGLIDPDDMGFEHVGGVRRERLNWGRLTDESAS